MAKVANYRFFERFRRLIGLPAGAVQPAKSGCGSIMNSNLPAHDPKQPPTRLQIGLTNRRQNTL